MREADKKNETCAGPGIRTLSSKARPSLAICSGGLLGSILFLFMVQSSLYRVPVPVPVPVPMAALRNLSSLPLLVQILCGFTLLYYYPS
jgi:hypothetical protein